MANFKALYAKWQRVIFRILKEAMLPTAGAAIWGAVVGAQKHSIIDGVSAAAIAFFFVLALQGQILRIAKNVRDEEDASDFRASFATLKEGLDELRSRETPINRGRARTHDSALPDLYEYRSQRPVPLGYESFFMQARAALDSEQYLAAALIAAVGFEHAARQAADQLGISTERAALGRMLREIASRTEEPNAAGFLSDLNRLRNSLAHGESDIVAMTREEAVNVVEAFWTGVRYIERAA